MPFYVSTRVTTQLATNVLTKGDEGVLRTKHRKRSKVQHLLGQYR